MMRRSSDNTDVEMSLASRVILGALGGLVFAGMTALAGEGAWAAMGGGIFFGLFMAFALPAIGRLSRVIAKSGKN